MLGTVGLIDQDGTLMRVKRDSVNNHSRTRGKTQKGRGHWALWSLWLTQQAGSQNWLGKHPRGLKAWVCCRLKSQTEAGRILPGTRKYKTVSQRKPRHPLPRRQSTQQVSPPTVCGTLLRARAEQIVHNSCSKMEDQCKLTQETAQTAFPGSSCLCGALPFPSPAPRACPVFMRHSRAKPAQFFSLMGTKTASRTKRCSGSFESPLQAWSLATLSKESC